MRLPQMKFWRNAVIVGVIHLIVLAGLARWSGSAKTPPLNNVVWLDAGALSETAPNSVAAADPEPEASATPEPSVTPMEDPLTMPTPPPEETPEPTAKATPSPTATPRPTARPKATPVRRSEKSVEAKRTRKKSSAKSTAKPSAAKKSASTRGVSGGSSSEAAASGTPSEVSWYANMLHDRFHRAWEQPTDVVGSGARLAVRVHLRIEPDGRVSVFKIVNRSGNVVVDDSIQALAGRVTQVDAPPAALLRNGACELNINFDWSGR